jgi:uncharacterized membrane protein
MVHAITPTLLHMQLFVVFHKAIATSMSTNAAAARVATALLAWTRRPTVHSHFMRINALAWLVSPVGSASMTSSMAILRCATYGIVCYLEV